MTRAAAFLLLGLSVAGPSLAEDARVAEGRALSRAGRPAAARTVLEAAVAADPQSRAARRALLEADVLLRDWQACNEQTAALEPFRDGEEVSMFYAAVALRETGSVASARPLAARARASLKRSRFVDWYLREILGD